MQSTRNCGESCWFLLLFAFALRGLDGCDRLIKLNPMSQRNPITIFLCRFALVFLILAVPWPGVSKAYGLFFRALAGMVFAGDNGQKELSFESQGGELETSV